MAKFVQYNHIFGRVSDVFFAVFIGVSAFALNEYNRPPGEPLLIDLLYKSYMKRKDLNSDQKVIETLRNNSINK